MLSGGASLILVDEDTLKAHNLTPLARVAGFSVAGVDPTIMGIGPVPAIRLLWEKTGVGKDQVDLYEVNEAFASQCLAVQKELGLDSAKYASHLSFSFILVLLLFMLEHAHSFAQFTQLSLTHTLTLSHTHPAHRLNTNGGAIALGHPLGMSGARILTHLTHELQRTKGRYAIGSACIGGGQGIAVLLERA